MTWTFTPVSGQRTSSGSSSMTIARRGCRWVGASSRLMTNGSSIARKIPGGAPGQPVAALRVASIAALHGREGGRQHQLGVLGRDADPGRVAREPAGEAVECVVGAVVAMVEERDRARAGPACELDGVVGDGVPEVGFGGELLGEQLRVVDEHVGVACELDGGGVVLAEAVL